MRYLFGTVLIYFVALAFPSALASYDEVINGYVSAVKAATLKNNLGSIDIPRQNIVLENQSFGKNVYSGMINTGPGVVFNITEFAVREGSTLEIVSMNQMVANITIYNPGPLAVDFPEFYFNFTDPFIFINNKGVRFNIERSIADLQLTFIKESGVCNVTVTSYGLPTLGHIRVDIQPQSTWQREEGNLADRYMEALHETIRILFENSLPDMIQRVINESGACLTLNI